MKVCCRSRGGCETYIADLARRLAADGHDVHLYARRWDASALPAALTIHRIRVPRVPRFLRPWIFGAACRRALASARSSSRGRLRQDLRSRCALSPGRSVRGHSRAQSAEISPSADAPPGALGPAGSILRTARFWPWIAISTSVNRCLSSPSARWFAGISRSITISIRPIYAWCASPSISIASTSAIGRAAGWNGGNNGICRRSTPSLCSRA